MRQIPTNKLERRSFGQFITKYDAAYGTGDPACDPDGEFVGMDGHIWMMLQPIEPAIVKEIWVHNKLNCDHPDSAYKMLDDGEDLRFHIKCYKVKRNILSSLYWGVQAILMIGEKQVFFGWYRANSIIEIFDSFETFMDAGIELRPNIQDL